MREKDLIIQKDILYDKLKRIKNKNFDYLKGAEKLKKAVKRIPHESIVEAIKSKMSKSEQENRLKKIYKIKENQRKEKIKGYFYQMRITAQKIKDQEVENKFFGKLLNGTCTKLREKILKKVLLQ